MNDNDTNREGARLTCKLDCSAAGLLKLTLHTFLIADLPMLMVLMSKVLTH